MKINFSMKIFFVFCDDLLQLDDLLLGDPAMRLLLLDVFAMR